MKKIIKLIILALPILLITGCSLIKDNLEGATIYTTIHPIKYLAQYLYNDYGDIQSIYPNGANVSTYELTKKQIKKYAKANLFIYNGKGQEKNIAKNLVNENNNLLIIDVADGLTYKYGIKELWLSPNNYQMLAKNIKNYLNLYLQSSIIKEDVNKKYNELAQTLSLKDAELRAIGKKAKELGTNTLVVSNDVFKFLEDYNFNIISLDDETLTEASFNTIKSSFDKGTYNTIFILDKNYTERINSILENKNVKTIDVDSMIYVESDNVEDYLSVMQEFIDNIENACIEN